MTANAEADLCLEFPLPSLIKRDTGLRAQHVEQFLKPMLTQLVDLCKSDFDEQQPIWQRYLMFVDFENPLAANLLRGQRVGQHEFARFLATFGARNLDLSPEFHPDIHSDLFFQEVYPFLVRFPPKMLENNPPQFTQRLREMATAQFFAELLRDDVPLQGNVQLDLVNTKLITLNYCPHVQVETFEATQLLLSLGVRVGCASFGPQVQASKAMQDFRAHYLRAWTLRDWTTLVELLRTIGIELT
jgi:hypothetical protein